MLNALLATAVVFVSVGILLYLSGLLFDAASVPLGALVERRRFQRHVARARRCDTLLEAGRADEALVELRAAFYLRPVNGRSLASAVANHHTGLLSRLLAITSDLHGGSVRLLSLAKTDRLLTERSELQRRYLVVRQGAPRERTREIVRDMRTNGAELDAALQQLIAEVRRVLQPSRPH